MCFVLLKKIARFILVWFSQFVNKLVQKAANDVLPKTKNCPSGQLKVCAQVGLPHSHDCPGAFGHFHHHRHEDHDRYGLNVEVKECFVHGLSVRFLPDSVKME
jgi:hypothetical protein